MQIRDKYGLTIVIPTLFGRQGSDNWATISRLEWSLPLNVEILFIGPSLDRLSSEFEQFEMAIDTSCPKLKTKMAFGGDSIYSAMNIGIEIAQGRFLYFCGDTDFPRLDNLALVCYEALKKSTHSRRAILGFVESEQRTFQATLPARRWLAIERNPTHHQGILYEASLLEIVGKYNSYFGVIGDYELNLRLRSLVWSDISDVEVYSSKQPFCKWELGGASSQVKMRNYIESYMAKRPYLASYEKILALLVEALCFIWASVRPSRSV